MLVIHCHRTIWAQYDEISYNDRESHEAANLIYISFNSIQPILNSVKFGHWCLCQQVLLAYDNLVFYLVVIKLLETWIIYLEFPYIHQKLKKKRSVLGIFVTFGRNRFASAKRKSLKSITCFYNSRIAAVKLTGKKRWNFVGHGNTFLIIVNCHSQCVDIVEYVSYFFVE